MVQVRKSLQGSGLLVASMNRAVEEHYCPPRLRLPHTSSRRSAATRWSPRTATAMRTRERRPTSS